MVPADDFRCGRTGTAPGSTSNILNALLLGGIVSGVAAGVLGGATATVSLPAGSVGPLYIAAFAIALFCVVVVSYLVWNQYLTLSSTPNAGTFVCAAGVVNAIDLPSLDIFQMQHGRVDLVVKQQYWNNLIIGNPPFLWCADCENCPSSVVNAMPSDGINCSPILRCYYRSAQVVAASLGEAIGATAGAIGGGILGIIGAVAIAGSVGCAITAIFSWACFIALALAIVIIAAAVGIASLLGAGAGSSTGAATTGSPTQLDASAPAINIGTFMSACGNLLEMVPDNGADVLWFTGWVADQSGNVIDLTAQTGSGTTTLGMAPSGLAPPFCVTVPDDPNTGIPGNPCIAATAIMQQALASVDPSGTLG